jgi:hypothetical protein
MADESEVIRRQMADTRADLASKLDQLESQVRDDVHAAATRVMETVDMVKEQIDSAKASVHNTVESVKTACSVTHHVEQRPWAMMAGAAAAGYIGATMLRRESGEHGVNPGTAYIPASSAAAHTAFRDEHANNGAAIEAQNQAAIAKLIDAFRPEILVLKGLAIGALVGIVRDMVVKSAPGTLEQPLGTVFDGVTLRLGGQPIRGQVIRRAEAPR